MGRMRPLSIVVMLALVALLGAQCQPPKPTGPTPGQYLGFYFTVEDDFGGDGYRSVAPHSRAVDGGTSAQALAPDGAVVLGVTDIGGMVISVDDGFTTLPFRLGDLATLQALLAAAPDGALQMGLWFDVDGDGDFLDWDPAGHFVGLGGDSYAFCTKTANLTTLEIGNSTQCDVISSGQMAVTRTIQQLKDGDYPGITADTLVVAVVYLHVPKPGMGTASASATVSALLLNGFDLLVP